MPNVSGKRFNIPVFLLERRRTEVFDLLLDPQEASLSLLQLRGQ